MVSDGRDDRRKNFRTSKIGRHVRSRTALDGLIRPVPGHSQGRARATVGDLGIAPSMGHRVRVVRSLARSSPVVGPDRFARSSPRCGRGVLRLGRWTRGSECPDSNRDNVHPKHVYYQVVRHSGWGSQNRTDVGCFKDSRPTIGRYPIILVCPRGGLHSH